MPQMDTLRALDARLARAFGAAGWTDTVLHTPGVGSPISRRAYVDRSVGFQGADGQVRTDLVLITVLLADGPVPRGGDTFTLGAETFTVDRIEQLDESRAVCAVAK